jgi:CubicO group peptidase (beta-lactamase class C family)
MTTTGGHVAPGFEPVRDAFELAHHDDPGGSQLAVYRDGEIVIDLWIGGDRVTGRPETGDTLHVLHSTTKGAMALAAAILASGGILDVDAPVREYWPEYAVRGKEHSTAAHFLSHTAGLKVFRLESGIRARDLGDWERCTSALAGSEPFWRPGQRVSYHALTYGFLVGEVIRRLTGLTEGAFFAREVAEPLGLDFWIGLPAEQDHRVTTHGPRTSDDVFDFAVGHGVPELAEINAAGRLLGPLLEEHLNTVEGRRHPLGAINGIANARSVARMYAATIGEVDGIRLLSSAGLDAATRSRTRGIPLWEPFAPLNPAQAELGLGFILGHPLGERSSATAFGHPGAGGVQGFAIRDRGVAVGYTCSAMHGADGRVDPRHAYLEALLEVGLI